MKRRLAREIALQSLYQMQMNEVTPKEAIAIAIEEAESENEAGLDVKDGKISASYIEELVTGTRTNVSAIDSLLEGYIKGYKLDRLSRVDREILRLAAYEMVYREDVPPKVVVNEAIELSKHFGTEESGKFVNGVLGKMIQDIEKLKQK
ncbi:N utilization substance protein B [Paenibacillus sp. J31TS4]|uniref:transcription antitermination factor NusB n=1 Tax=Paenibacillus sp. J31TS4 TaxID=2807195 RepID=UPI001B22FE05|nr:transcription antitermination factor NusB [Paenibacillus sp. J31TS4]GIP37604.1 N utilization substance protein B [Paenibacillus sp. J31TS4]